jgi:hypothetical protein
MLFATVGIVLVNPYTLELGHAGAPVNVGDASGAYVEEAVPVVRYVEVSTDPSAFKNSEDVPDVLTNDVPVIALPAVMPFLTIKFLSSVATEVHISLLVLM